MKAVAGARSHHRVVAIVAVLLASVTGILWAHVALIRSEPAKDARLAAPPTRLHLVFSEAVEPSTSRIELVSPLDERFTLRPARPASDSVQHLEAAVPALSVGGVYRVEWRLIGADGHPVTGSYSFAIDSIPPPPTADTVAVLQPAGPDQALTGIGALAADAPVAVFIRFLGILSLIVVVGSAVIGLVVVPRVAAPLNDSRDLFVGGVNGRLGSMVVAAGWTLLLVTVTRLAMQAVALAGSLRAVTVGDLADIAGQSRWGTGWVLQAIAAVLVLLAIRGGPQRVVGRPGRWRLIAASGVLLALGASAMGHPAAVPEAPLIAMGLDALHALGAGSWVGGLVGLGIAVLPRAMSLPEALRTESVRRSLRAFSPVALASASALAVTGLIGGWWQLRGDPMAVIETGYGRLLLAKIGAVLIVALLGAYHWRVVQPAVGDGRSMAALHRSVRWELLLMMIVVVLTAVLTGTAPAGAMP
jgi:copper transport protein